MVIVTYDEFGGQWDHVSPPGQGHATPGPHDKMGPWTRIPALTLAPGLRHGFTVDRASHDTTSIMATIEHRFGLRRWPAATAASRTCRRCSTADAVPCDPQVAVVGVAQLVELLVVVQAVGGSSPLAHPPSARARAAGQVNSWSGRLPAIALRVRLSGRPQR